MKIHVERAYCLSMAALATASFLIFSGKYITIFILIVFLLTVPGLAILGLIKLKNHLDPIEHVISLIIISLLVTFIPLFIIETIWTIDWQSYVALLLSPIVIAATIVGMLTGLGDVRVKGRNSFSMDINSMDRKEKGLVVIVTILLVLASTGLVLSTNQDENDEFTEFYVLNEKGKIDAFPDDLLIGSGLNITIGIVNHEDRPINYTIEVWLVNYTFIDMAVNVTQMYYVDTFSVVLNSTEYDLNEPWSPQYERRVTINPLMTGDYYVYMILFKDSREPLPHDPPLDPTLDYSKTVASWRIVLCQIEELTYLRLHLDVHY